MYLSVAKKLLISFKVYFQYNKGHNHSNYARMIINDLIQGVYDKQLRSYTSQCVVQS